MFKAAAKLRLNSRLDDLARHSPVRERDPEDLPGFNFPRGYAAEPILFSIVSPLDPNFLHMPLHKDGESPLLCCVRRINSSKRKRQRSRLDAEDAQCMRASVQWRL